MSTAICIAMLACTILAFAIGYLAGWLDGKDRQIKLDEIPHWVRRATTVVEGADDAR